MSEADLSASEYVGAGDAPSDDLADRAVGEIGALLRWRLVIDLDLVLGWLIGRGC